MTTPSPVVSAKHEGITCKIPQKERTEEPQRKRKRRNKRSSVLVAERPKMVKVDHKDRCY